MRAVSTKIMFKAMEKMSLPATWKGGSFNGLEVLLKYEDLSALRFYRN